MASIAEKLGDLNELAALAAATPKSKRNEIYMAVATLYRLQSAQLSERERGMMREILKRLTLDVEMAIRITLAERLADDPEAPLDLILMLADDTVEVARPIILRSQRLTDAELLSFIAGADVERQAVCASRPQIGEPVTEKLAQCSAEPVLVALVRNATARIANDTFAALVEKSRDIVSLQDPLARREDLPPALASRLSGWASEALKEYLVKSGRLSAQAAAEAVDDAARRIAEPNRSDPREGGRKLVEKLAVAGQLKPGFLLRVLQQGQTELFELAFAKLLDVDLTVFCEIFYRRGPRMVALSCRAVGIDRSVFTTVFSLSRQTRSINPILSQDERVEIDTVFGEYSRDAAGAALKKLARV